MFAAIARFVVAAAVLVVSLSTNAGANTITQNTSWTIDRAGTSTSYRVVAYGDSIYAGYYGSLSRVGKRAAPWVEGEYLSAHWNSDVQVYRRTKSGAVASDIYQNKIVNEDSYMQSSNTRVVTFEMCGNDGLQARSSFAGQSGTCNYGVLDTALANCTNYQELAMQYINANAHANTELKIIANLYYPGYDADDALANCTDSTSGQRPNKQEIMLPYIVKMNWRACNFANTYGFECADSFAEYMGADYDSNGDSLIDSEALRYVQGESEANYVTRITQTLRATVRDANFHFANNTTSFDYIQSDDTHPTYTGSTIYVGFFGGTGSGSGAPDYPTITGGKNPIWNQYGHERMGWSLWKFSDAPAATPTPTATPLPPTNTPTSTPIPPTDTPAPTNTPVPPTDTPLPTNTPMPTNTPLPTNTPAPPTNTPLPTDTPVPPTDTPLPTDTPVPPTNTPLPTDTPVPPTDTPTNTPAASQQIVLLAVASEDGWVRESNETSNVGGRTSATGSGSKPIRAGDATSDRQYKAIVSFDTAPLPAGATVLSATLELTKGGNTGTNPLTGGFGTCRVDISEAFNGSAALENADFQAAADAASVGTIPNLGGSGTLYSIPLDGAALPFIDGAAGRAQLRLQFDVDDNDDGGNDFAGFYSGDNSNASRRPRLVVEYQP